jgi:Family of unknown function (DUF6502)
LDERISSVSNAAGAITAPTPASPALMRALRHVMRPIVRLMIRHGVVMQSFNDLAKSVFTEIAEREILANGEEATDSRITLMTGIHRAEVKRLRDAGFDAFMLSPTLSTGADVVTLWLTDRRFSANRVPRPLSVRKGDTGNTFSLLVRSVNPELRPFQVLAEMSRLGVVSVADHEAKLLLDSFVPQRGFDDKLEYFAENGHDHLAAAVQNLANERPALLEQSVSANALSAASVTELSTMARTLWKLVMQQIVDRAIELEAKDAASGKATSRMNFGVYFYNEGQNQVASDDTRPAKQLPGKKAKRGTGVNRKPSETKLRSNNKSSR